MKINTTFAISIKTLKYITFGLSFILLSSCISSLVRLDKNTTEFDPKQAYMVMGFDSNAEVTQMVITGTNHIRLGGEHFKKVDDCLVFPMPPGNYSLSSFWRGKGAYYPLAKYGDKEGLWEFTVKPGKINYLGHFVLEVNRYGISELDEAASWVIANRASFTLECMKKNYSALLQAKDIIYARSDKDPFFERYNELKKQKREQ